ncbi:MAG TPA: DUF4268 domain-containing protein [Candidatus Merdivicinus faecavium]|nr:DUF4268 domain-containing protein [Candidatus Merdivicinus faecavium]
MSILDAFDPLSPEVIRPTEMFQRLDHCPEFFIVPFKTRIIDCLLSQYGAEQICLVHGNLPVCRFDYRGHILGCYPTQLGGPASVYLMEDLIAKGAKKFLFFGSCGALDESLAAGHLIIPSEAYRDEGTSYHYLPPSDYVEIPTAPKLKAVLDRLELPERKGSRILVEKPVELDDRSNWSRQFDWLMDTCLRMKRAFQKHLDTR